MSLREEIVICDTCNGKGNINVRITGYESDDVIGKE